MKELIYIYRFIFNPFWHAPRSKSAKNS